MKDFFKDQCSLNSVFEDEVFEDAEYEGREVELNKPFRTPKESKKFAVYVKNDKGNVVVVRFGDPDMEIKRDDPERQEAFRARHNCPDAKDKTKAKYWSCKFWSSKKVSELLDKEFKDTHYFTETIQFNDNAIDGNVIKNVISVRDGYQEYLGVELGLEPLDKVFKVYRSKETIEAINDMLKNIPVTKGHVELEDNIPEELKMGKIRDSQIIPSNTGDKDSTINVKNVITLDENKLKFNNSKELSLGYFADSVKHTLYDLEQINIRPHHLAIVDKGRCGGGCKFLDEKGVKMDVKEIMKNLKDMRSKLSDEDKKMLDMELGKMTPKQETKDAEKEDKDPKAEEKMKDMEKEYKDSLSVVASDAVSKFKDSKEYLDAMNEYADARVSVIEKASGYLDSDYEFKGKTNMDIMADALKAERPQEQFLDSEVGVAFKMLNKKVKDSYSTVEVATSKDAGFANVEIG